VSLASTTPALSSQSQSSQSSPSRKKSGVRCCVAVQDGVACQQTTVAAEGPRTTSPQWIVRQAWEVQTAVPQNRHKKKIEARLVEETTLAIEALSQKQSQAAPIQPQIQSLSPQTAEEIPKRYSTSKTQG
jgi:hypothetical protein